MGVGCFGLVGIGLYLLVCVFHCIDPSSRSYIPLSLFCDSSFLVGFHSGVGRYLVFDLWGWFVVFGSWFLSLIGGEAIRCFVLKEFGFLEILRENEDPFNHGGKL